MNPSRLIYLLIFVFWFVSILPLIPALVALLLAALAASRGMWIDATVLTTIGLGLLIALMLRKHGTSHA